MEIHHGVIVNVNDPDQLGRVQVRVYNSHTDNTEELPNDDLPWSFCMAPTTTPGISGLGHSTYLVNGASVIGTYTDNYCQSFLILGTIPTIATAQRQDASKGFCDADQVFPKQLGAPDNNPRARGGVPLGVSGDIDEAYLGTKQPVISSYAPEYPHNHVYETTSGHVKEYDDTPGYERIHEKHRSGTYYELNPDGSKVERINGDNYQLIVGDNTLEITGDINIIIGGDALVTVAGALEARVGGNIHINGDMNASINLLSNLTATIGGDILINTSRSCTINAKEDINLNASRTMNLFAEEDISIKSNKNIKVLGENIYLNE